MSTTMVNTKISEIERKISDAKGLVVTNVLNTKNEEAENKIPDANVGVKKMVYNAKYQTLRQTILLLLIIISFKVTHL